MGINTLLFIFMEPASGLSLHPFPSINWGK